MTLKEYTVSLSKDGQIQVAIHLAKLALPIWESYADRNQLTYSDTVVGMSHTVDRKLLKNTINAAESFLNAIKINKGIDDKRELNEIRRQFDEPIVALQDTDWELPDEVQKTFYAVYNLIETLLGKENTVFDESTIYVSINQAVDALESSKTLNFDDINKILDNFKKTAGKVGCTMLTKFKFDTEC